MRRTAKARWDNISEEDKAKFIKKLVNARRAKLRVKKRESKA